MKALQTNIKLFLYTPNKFFEIPNFQRPYSWTADNVQMFLDDLEEVKRGDKKHYFGSIVYINNARIDLPENLRDAIQTVGAMKKHDEARCGG